MSPLLTFSIPYYEGTNIQLARMLLRKTLQSIQTQTRDGWVAIICHNGAYSQALDQLVKDFSDPRITLHNNGENIGAIANFNLCLNLPKTPLVTILHADDQLLPNYTDEVLQAAEQYPNVSLYYCKTRIIDINGKPIFSMPDFVKKIIEPGSKGDYTLLEGEAALSRILIGNFIFCPTIAYRKSKIESFRFTDQWNALQDMDFMTRLLINGHRFLGINKAAYAYRRHTNHTALYRQNLSMFFEESRFADHIAKICANMNWFHAERVARNKLMIRFNILYCAMIDLVNCRFNDFVNKGRIIFSIGKLTNSL